MFAPRRVCGALRRLRRAAGLLLPRRPKSFRPKAGAARARWRSVWLRSSSKPQVLHSSCLQRLSPLYQTTAAFPATLLPPLLNSRANPYCSRRHVRRHCARRFRRASLCAPAGSAGRITAVNRFFFSRLSSRRAFHSRPSRKRGPMRWHSCRILWSTRWWSSSLATLFWSARESAAGRRCTSRAPFPLCIFVTLQQVPPEGGA